MSNMDRLSRNEKSLKKQILLSVRENREGVSFSVFLRMFSMSVEDRGYLHILLLDLCRDGYLRLGNEQNGALDQMIFFAGDGEKIYQYLGNADFEKKPATDVSIEKTETKEQPMPAPAQNLTGIVKQCANGSEEAKAESVEEVSDRTDDTQQKKTSAEYAEILYRRLVKGLKRGEKWKPVRKLLVDGDWPKEKEVCRLLPAVLIQMASEGKIEIRTEKDRISGVRPSVRFCEGCEQISDAILTVLSSIPSPTEEKSDGQEVETEQSNNSMDSQNQNKNVSEAVDVETLKEELSVSGKEESENMGTDVSSDEAESELDERPETDGNGAHYDNQQDQTQIPYGYRDTPTGFATIESESVKAPVSQEEIQKEIYRVLYENPGFHSIEAMKSLSPKLKLLRNYKIISNANILKAKNLIDEIITRPPDLVMFLYAAKQESVQQPALENSIKVKPEAKLSNDKDVLDFMEYCRVTPMSCGYKMILIMAFMKHANDMGNMHVDDAVLFFRQYYDNRRSRKPRAEKKNTIFDGPDASSKSLRKNIIDNPVRELKSGGYFSYDSRNEMIRLRYFVWSKLNERDREQVVNICQSRLKKYYGEN